MNRLGELPNPRVLYDIFVKTVPWFPDWYDTRYIERATETNWPESKWELFRNGHGHEKVHGRLRYLFDEPGDSKTGKKRKYGISVEHPDNPKGNRRSADLKCSVEILRRLKLGIQISEQEITEWSLEKK